MDLQPRIGAGIDERWMLNLLGLFLEITGLSASADESCIAHRL
jgi:hypothetical protein